MWRGKPAKAEQIAAHSEGEIRGAEGSRSPREGPNEWRASDKSVSQP